MAHIGCLCGNDIRGNNNDVRHRFVSDGIMTQERNTPFFGIPFEIGDKADIWICNECERAVFFDDGGLRVTRIMRAADPNAFELSRSMGKPGYFYNEEQFFNEVDEYLTKEWEAGREPEYEFFYESYADGAPLLTESVMREKIFNNPQRTFGHWSRALLETDHLAVFGTKPNFTTERPRRLWILSKEDTFEVTKGRKPA